MSIFEPVLLWCFVILLTLYGLIWFAARSGEPRSDWVERGWQHQHD